MRPHLNTQALNLVRRYKNNPRVYEHVFLYGCCPPSYRIVDPGFVKATHFLVYSEHPNAPNFKICFFSSALEAWQRLRRLRSDVVPFPLAEALFIMELREVRKRPSVQDLSTC